MVKLTTETKVPKYLPKIKPVVKAIGEAKPKSNIHTIVKIKNITVKIIKFWFFKSIKTLVESFIYAKFDIWVISKKLKNPYKSAPKQVK